MKGKNEFTKIEIHQIKMLIADKILATSTEQKNIRDKIRKIGFYFSDFSSKKGEYTLEFFENLIWSGQIIIVENNAKSSFSPNNLVTPFRQAKKIKDNNQELSEHNKRSFEAIVDDNTTVLILGSMPGDKSLAVGEYYANSGNRFWKILANVTEENIPLSYTEKLSMLTKYNIGLWDVAQTANRKGSLDSDMSGEIPNDIDRFLDDHPKIKIIGFNGGRAGKLFFKFFIKKPHLIYYNLSSSSGANTSINFKDSCNDWKRIFQ